MDKSGIYKITCSGNGRIYVGSAVNIKKRWQSHVSQLRSDTHHSRYMQRAFNKYGEDSFSVSILEHVDDVERLVAREQFWIDETDCLNRKIGFNTCPKAGSTLGFKFSDESKQVMSESKSKKYIGGGNPFFGKTHSKETKEKIAAAKRGKPLSDEHKESIKKGVRDNPHIKRTQFKNGHVWDEATQQKMREYYKNNPVSDEERRKRSERMKGESNPMFGKSHSEESRRKLSDRMKGENHPFFGRKHSEETKRKISESRKRNLSKKKSA